MQRFRVVETSVKNFLKEPRNVIVARKAPNEILNGYHFNILRTAMCQSKVCSSL